MTRIGNAMELYVSFFNHSAAPQVGILMPIFLTMLSWHEELYSSFLTPWIIRSALRNDFSWMRQPSKQTITCRKLSARFNNRCFCRNRNYKELVHCLIGQTTLNSAHHRSLRKFAIEGLIARRQTPIPIHPLPITPCFTQHQPQLHRYKAMAYTIAYVERCNQRSNHCESAIV